MSDKNFSVKVYNYPGSHLKELPKNVLDLLEAKYDLVTDDEEEISEFLKEHSLLVVESDGTIIFSKFDGGEPEDNSFVRDLAWIPGLIQRAYNIGDEKGYERGYNSCEQAFNER
jgi:hypothetical protein